MFEKILENVAAMTPLVHCITNYVTANDCANILLACGGSPIMADDVGEAAEITELCNGLVLNIGTLNARTVASMLAAGRRANALGNPVVFDPVGAGASELRTRTALEILQVVHCAVIRGNSSEIRAVAQMGGNTQGVDAADIDVTTEENLDAVIVFAKQLAAKRDAIVAITGAIDVVATAKSAYIIRNGCAMMSKVSGTGCMLTAVIAAYCAANPTELFAATAAAVCAMGTAGELAYQRVLRTHSGTGKMRVALLDEMSRMDAKTLNRGMEIERR